MKNYLKLSSVSEIFTNIIPLSSYGKGKTTSKEKPFVILNTDLDNGLYIRRLVEQIKNYEVLNEQPKVLRKRSLKNIKTGDLILFGDMLGSVNYDYRVETDAKSLDHIDGRRFKVYDLITDFTKVIKRLEKYVEENYLSGKVLDIFEDEEDVKVTNININVNTLNRRPSYVTPIAILKPVVKEEKVTIFDNWVKIGYNQYDIMCNLFGDEFIYVSGNKYFIKSDRFGRKYLTLNK